MARTMPFVDAPVMHLIVQLFAATALVAVTCAMHLFGIGGLMLLLRRHRKGAGEAELIRQALTIGAAATGLLLLHAKEIWLYAGFYIVVHALPGLETALYFSTASYTQRWAMAMSCWVPAGGSSARSKARTASSCWAGLRPSSLPSSDASAGLRPK